MKPTKRLNSLIKNWIGLIKFCYDSKYSEEFIDAQLFVVDNGHGICSIRNIKEQLSSIDFNLLVENIEDEKLKKLTFDNLIKLKFEIEDYIKDGFIIIKKESEEMTLENMFSGLGLEKNKY
jgi:hypothetical protein